MTAASCDRQQNTGHRRPGRGVLRDVPEEARWVPALRGRTAGVEEVEAEQENRCRFSCGHASISVRNNRADADRWAKIRNPKRVPLINEENDNN